MGDEQPAKTPIQGTQTKNATSCGTRCVTHILWASTNHQWGSRIPTDGSFTLLKKGDIHIVRQIRKAAVLGSGVMGSGIAAHLANIGIPTLLLDMVPQELTEIEKKQGLTLEDKSVRNRMSQAAKLKLLKQKPSPLTSQKNLSLIEVGNFEDDLIKLQDVDWVIEVVVENIDVKKSIFEKVDQYRKPGSIVSSNTSGISVEAMAEGRSEDFQKHFLGTHFFNPPRYLKLLEVIPTKYTESRSTFIYENFGEDVLGKGVVTRKIHRNLLPIGLGHMVSCYGSGNDKRRI